MTDLISRKALLDGLIEWRDKDPYKKKRSLIERWIRTSGIDILITVVKYFPAVEAEPVRHGTWVGLEYDGYADGCPVYDLWECSECGEEVRGEDVPDTHPWCHGCGTKMDGERKDNG